MKQLMKWLTPSGLSRLVIVASVSLPGCAALKAIDLMSPASKGLSVDAELTVGDKEETVETNVGTSSFTQQAEQITNVRDIPFTWVILFTLMAGWAIPSPQQMGAGLIAFLKILLPWAGRR